MNATAMLSSEELKNILDQKYQRRVYVAEDIKEYVCSLPPEKAFALSRLLPKEVLAKLLPSNLLAGTNAFADNIIEYASMITIDGKLNDVIAKQCEELFLVTHADGLLKVIGS